MNIYVKIFFPWTEPHQDVSLQEQAGFDGDADASVAVSLHIAAVEGGKTMKSKLQMTGVMTNASE